MMSYLIGYLLVINLITFVLYGDDKARARRGAWRISEDALITAAVIGGSLGALFGMYLFHHKTRHLKFVIGIPVIMMIQIMIGLFIGSIYK